jgi:hypothetical protein
VGGVKTFRALRWRTMVAFHKNLRVALTIADEVMFRNKISTGGVATSAFPICSKRTPTFKIRRDVSVVSNAFQLGGG